MTLFIGTAGWSIPGNLAKLFPAKGTALERYASKFGVAEINSSFHRPHRILTWERWYNSVPPQFRFSVKLPKQITHLSRMVDCDEELDLFVEQAATLKEKLAVMLVQLPPKLSFDGPTARDFLTSLRARTTAAIVCEPRHAAWFSEEADDLLVELGVARVAADPSICEAAARPGGWPGLRYWRLHGSPVIYRSSYQDRLDSFAANFREHGGPGADVWCIFDNTASSAATADALALLGRLTEV